MDPMIEIATRLQSFGLLGSAVLIILKATLVLLIVRMLVAAVPRASAAAKHLAITIALCSVVVLPIVALIAPAWRLGILPPAQSDEVRQARAIGSTGDDQEEPSGLAAAITVAKATGVVPAERISAVHAFLSTIRNSWQGLILLFLAAISLVFLGRMAVGVLGVRAVVRRATEVEDDVALKELDHACDHLRLQRHVRIFRSADVTVPVVWGYFKPILLLPASSTEWTAERLRVVLLHELAHVKRGDGFTLLITKAAVAIFWFHPLMWTLETAARRECERACDDLALAEGGTKASDYAEHLLSIAKALPQFDPFKSVTLAMSRRSQLEGRLLSILQPHIRRGAFSSRYVGIVAAFALFLIVPLASVRLVAAPQKETTTTVGKEPVVEIGPAVAAKVTPEAVLAQFDKLKNRKDKWLEWGDSKKTPTTGKEWYDYGYEMHREDRYPEAIAAFKEALARKYRIDASEYNIACGYALMGDAANATKWLRDAVDHGFDSFGHIGSDSDLDPIRSTPEFQAFVQDMKSVIRQRGDDEDEIKELTEKVDETAQKLVELKESSSRDGGEWFSVGLDLLRLRKIDESIDAFKKAIDLDSRTSTSMYNIACAYSLKGDTNTAITWLRKAVEHGFDSVDKMENDPDLQNARRHPQFDDITMLAEDLGLHHGWKNWLNKWFAGDDAEAWRAELPRYRALTQKYPTIGRTWFNLGYAQLQAGDNLAGADSFQKALNLGYRPGTSAYNTACAYAKAERIDAAFEWLNKARSMGFKLHNYLDGDDDLENLRDDPRYRQLRKEVREEKERDERDGKNHDK